MNENRIEYIAQDITDDIIIKLRDLVSNDDLEYIMDVNEFEKFLQYNIMKLIEDVEEEEIKKITKHQAPITK
jgi:hypothetical protein